jgi:hypothetical protein
MSTTGTSGAAAAAGTAKDEAAGLAQSAAQSGQGLLGEAKEGAAGVVHEATGQARDLLGEARTGLRGQAADQQGKAAASLRSLGDELGRMADGSEQGGLAADLVRQVAGRTDTVATWLEDREPGDVLNEVADFARRRPGVFLAVAAGAGVLAGRLTRGLKDAPSGSSGGQSRSAAGGAPAAQFSSDAPTQDLSGALGAAGGPGVVAGGTAQVDEIGAESGGLHREPGPAVGEPAPWTPTSEQQAWAASGGSGEAPVTPTPGHLPTADDPGTAGGDPLAGVRREDGQ